MRHRYVLLGMTSLLAACGGSDAPSATGPTTTTPTPAGSTSRDVSLANFAFSPSATTVPVGATVTWTWNDGAVLHNVTFADNVSSTNRSTGTFQRTFTTAGTYTYRCTLHAGMTGTVTVQ